MNFVTLHLLSETGLILFAFFLFLEFCAPPAVPTDSSVESLLRQTFHPFSSGSDSSTEGPSDNDEEDQLPLYIPSASTSNTTTSSRGTTATTAGSSNGALTENRALAVIQGTSAFKKRADFDCSEEYAKYVRDNIDVSNFGWMYLQLTPAYQDSG